MGPHIHHGYWEAEETPRVAQEQLTRRLANLASIKPESVVYDIGCGMGGSSIWLGAESFVRCEGVTLSPVQQKWASSTAALKRIKPRPTFRCADAELIEFPDESADIVWSIECTEHLFDKPKFFNRAARWLQAWR